MERKPLTACINSATSKLPVPGSRQKRIRSPSVNETPISTGKKQCTDQSRTAGVLRKQASSSNVVSSTKPPVSRLTSTKSSTNLVGTKRPITRPGVTRNTTTGRATHLVTATAPRPAHGRPPPSASNASLNSTIVSTGGPKLNKKRPAWDLKGRLADMEAHMQTQTLGNTNLQSQLTENNFRIAHLESLNQKLAGDVQEKQQVSQSAVKEAEELKEKIKQSEQKLEDIEFQKSTLSRQKASLEGELEAAMKQIRSLQAAVAEATSTQALIKAELETSKQLLDTSRRTAEERDQTIKELNTVVEERDKTIAGLEAKERAHETERRKLHNQVQELKGNIRVFCRVRPLLGDEELGTNGVIAHMTFPDLDHKVLELDKLADASGNESALNGTRSLAKYDFSFDRVFQPDSGQREVFEDISQLVQSALDGYHVCIFAYGQTGAGKTFTMEGCLDDEDLLGMIPRTVQQIFHAARDLETKGWTYTIRASMLEIYNENLYDLLKRNGRDEKLDIKLQGKGEDVHVPKLTVLDVKSEHQVLNLLKLASENRSVAETKCNQRSSRSHSVFQLRLEGSNSMTGESSKGVLNLVDLAGSERVKDSGSEGQRLVEAQAINKSLSSLGNVIMALGNKEKHIPYRNSKLTYLLQNSLGGNSKTLMFVNVSPKVECFSETLNSLRFATKVNQTNIGTAHKKN